jgi:hypothetical protein
MRTTSNKPTLCRCPTYQVTAAIRRSITKHSRHAHDFDVVSPCKWNCVRRIIIYYSIHCAHNQIQLLMHRVLTWTVQYELSTEPLNAGESPALHGVLQQLGRGGSFAYQKGKTWKSARPWLLRLSRPIEPSVSFTRLPPKYRAWRSQLPHSRSYALNTKQAKHMQDRVRPQLPPNTRH